MLFRLYSLSIFRITIKTFLIFNIFIVKPTISLYNSFEVNNYLNLSTLEGFMDTQEILTFLREITPSLKDSLGKFDNFIPDILKSKLGIIANIIFFALLIVITSTLVSKLTNSHFLYTIGIIIFIVSFLFVVTVYTTYQQKKQIREQNLCKEIRKLLNSLAVSNSVEEFFNIIEQILRLFSKYIEENKSEQFIANLNTFLDSLKDMRGKAREGTDDLLNMWIPAGEWLKKNREQLVSKTVEILVSKEENMWLSNHLDNLKVGIDYHIEWILENINEATKMDGELIEDLPSYLSSKNVIFRDHKTYKEAFNILKEEIILSSKTELNPAARDGVLLRFIRSIIYRHTLNW